MTTTKPTDAQLISAVTAAARLLYPGREFPNSVTVAPASTPSLVNVKAGCYSTDARDLYHGLVEILNIQVIQMETFAEHYAKMKNMRQAVLDAET